MGKAGVLSLSSVGGRRRADVEGVGALLLDQGLAADVLELRAVVPQIVLDLRDLQVDLLDEHGGVVEDLLEAALLRLHALDDALLQRVDAANTLGREGVHLRAEVGVRVARQDLAVLGDQIDPVVVLHVLMLDLVQARGVVVDHVRGLLPHLEVAGALGPELLHDLGELLESGTGTLGLRVALVLLRLRRRPHPLSRRLRHLLLSLRTSGRPPWIPATALGSSSNRSSSCSGRGSR